MEVAKLRKRVARRTKVPIKILEARRTLQKSTSLLYYYATLNHDLTTPRWLIRDNPSRGH